MESCIRPNTPLLHRSNTPIFLFSVAIKLLYKAACLDLLQQPWIDEILRVCAFGARVCLAHLRNAEFHVFDVWIGNALECVGIDSLGFLEHRSIRGLSVFSDNVHREGRIRLESMDRFNVRLEEFADGGLSRTQ